MSDLISKALLSGLGLASLTRDAIQKTAEDLVKRSNLSEEEGKRLVKHLHQRSAKAQKAFEKKIESAVNKALNKLNLEIVHHASKVAKPAKTKPPAKAARGGHAGKSGSR